MITEQALKEAILECEGERNPNASTCIKLAAFYVIRNEMFGEKPQYSYASAPVESPELIPYFGDSDLKQLMKEDRFIPITADLFAEALLQYIKSKE